MKSFFLIPLLLISGYSIAQNWQTKYKIGDQVELKINDAMWQKGVVAENPPEGLLRVRCEEYIDPSSSYTRAGGLYIVHSSSDIRFLKNQPASRLLYKRGDKVEAKDGQGKWYAATILETKGNGYLVHWDGFSSTYDQIVSADNIRKKSAVQNSSANKSELYIGEYACYGTGGRLMAGMGFILLPGGRYYDVDKQRGGRYVYSPGNKTIRFVGGFLSGQVGKDVKSTGFQISNTVFAEPWK